MRFHAAIITVFMMLGGIGLAEGQDTTQAYGPDHPLAKGERYLAKGQYLNAADFYRTMSRRFAGTAIGLEACYLEAESHRRAGRYARAVDSYRRLQREYPFTRKAEQAQYQIAWCYAQQKIPSSLQAVSAVDLLLAAYPESPYREQALALREEALGRQKASSQSKSAPPDAVFARAKEHFERRKYIDAMEGFRDVIYNNPGTRLAAEATFYLGECYFHTKDYQAAVDEYARLLDEYPSSPYADDAQFMLAHGYFKQSPHYALDQKETGEKARAAAARFFERFPESQLASEVKQLQAKIDEKLARKEYEAGRIYFKMKNHKSARIYFKYVLEHYPETPWAPKSRDYLSQLDRIAPADNKTETDGAGGKPTDQDR